MFRALVASAVLLVAATANAQPGPHGASPAPAYGAPVVVVQRPGARGEEFDLLRLAAEYDAAAARRDVRALSLIENRVKAELRADLRGFGRGHGEGQVLRGLERLAGRFDRRAVQAKRDLIRDAVKLARFDGSRGRWDDGRHGPDFRYDGRRDDRGPGRG